MTSLATRCPESKARTKRMRGLRQPCSPLSENRTAAGPVVCPGRGSPEGDGTTRVHPVVQA